MRGVRTAVGLVLCLCASAVSLCAQAVPGVAARDAWIREATAAQSSAAYLVIENRGLAPARLVSAEVEGAGVVELHEMKMSGEMMSMAKVPSIEIPAGATVDLKPGGLHLMLFQLKRAFEPGRTATITLRFAGGGVVTLRAEIRKKAATGQ